MVRKKNKPSTRRSLDITADQIIGHNLRRIRLRKGRSQIELGEQLGITFQQIQKYENGKNRISASTLYTISKALDIRIIDFFLGLDGSSEQIEPISRENLDLLNLYACIPSDEMRNGIKKMMRSLIPVAAQRRFRAG